MLFNHVVLVIIFISAKNVPTRQVSLRSDDGFLERQILWEYVYITTFLKSCLQISCFFFLRIQIISFYVYK